AQPRPHGLPDRRQPAHHERAQRDRDRLLPHLPRRVARPGRARQDNRARRGRRRARGPADGRARPAIAAPARLRPGGLCPAQLRPACLRPRPVPPRRPPRPQAAKIFSRRDFRL
ncbi:MAG: hypothetical protein AVDCRST_MAG39-417, partial [uncultured Sphingomonadaceae bacterium]